MGAIVASLITAFMVAVFGSIGIGWSGWFLAYALVLVPVLIWHERRSREDYLTDASIRGPKPVKPRTV
jgi:hypothetical protein